MVRRSLRLMSNTSGMKVADTLLSSLPISTKSNLTTSKTTPSTSSNYSSNGISKPKGITSKKRKKANDSDVLFTLDRVIEERYWNDGHDVVCGVDEAGRGPLAGPVVAAACIVPRDVNIIGINDSKKINEETREMLYEQLTTNPKVIWAVQEIDHKEIDKINILQASMEAMRRAVAKLRIQPTFAFIDGPKLPGYNGKFPSLPMEALPIIKGDSKCYSIAAASVIAKVYRDRIMKDLDKKYPQYLFAQNKGYPTAQHKALVYKHGPCPVHRLTFAPLKHMQLKTNSSSDKSNDDEPVKKKPKKSGIRAA